MKKLIAVSMMLALVVGGAFAIEISGQVFSNVTLLQGDNDDDSDVTGDGSIARVRLHGSAENADGTIGGWFRLIANPGSDFNSRGHAWWRPNDMFWMAIGSSGGWFGAEGNTAWGFYRNAGDAVANPGNAWGGGFASIDFDLGDLLPDLPDLEPPYNGEPPNGIFPDFDDFDGFSITTRDAFYYGFGDADGQAGGLALSITPMDMLSLNFGLPFIQMAGAEVGDIFASLHAQVALNLDFGTIAITYVGSADDDNSGTIFAYFGMGSDEDALRLDVGLGVHLWEDATRIYAGLGVEFDVSAELGLRTRLVAGFGGRDDAESISYDPFSLIFDLMPFFRVSDNLTAFVSIGMAMFSFSDDSLIGTAVDAGFFDTATPFGWHLNPFIEFTPFGGMSLFAGFRLWSMPTFAEDATIRWAVPIGFTLNL